MYNLGSTRSSCQPDHLLLTPDTFVRTSWNGMKNAMAIVHASPAVGAAFTEYTAEFEKNGILGATDDQRFIFVLEGSLKVIHEGREHSFSNNMFAYIPPGTDYPIYAAKKTRALVIEKKYVLTLGQKIPSFFVGKESSIKSQPLEGDDWLQVRSLLPDDPAFDFTVNTMTYRPGAGLPKVEIHVMEHGLLMLEGGGIYRLNDRWYPVSAGDFIWMAPYCPQWFGAIGKTPAKYIIYKDWNRHPLA
jgi:(S)-ureidoglycine aminohydrolase